MQNQFFINDIVSVAVQQSYIPTLLYQKAVYEMTGSETFDAPATPAEIKFLTDKNKQPYGLASVAFDKAKEYFMYGNNGAQLPTNTLVAVLFDYRGCTVPDTGRLMAEQSLKLAEITARSGNQQLTVYYRSVYSSLTSNKSFKDNTLSWCILGYIAV